MAYSDSNDVRSSFAKMKHYENNKEQYQARSKIVKDKIRQLMIEAKSRPCMDCNITYPFYVMDFDHRPGTFKKFSPAQLVNCGSIRLTLVEIAKCDVVCANCHRIRTWNRNNVSLA